MLQESFSWVAYLFHILSWDYVGFLSFRVDNYLLGALHRCVSRFSVILRRIFD